MSLVVLRAPFSNTCVQSAAIWLGEHLAAMNRDRYAAPAFAGPRISTSTSHLPTLT